MEVIMKTVKYLDKFGLSIKDASKKIENVAKEQKDGFLSLLLGILGPGLLGNLLSGKGARAMGQ